MIVERVKNGLANAKAKGIRIGRVKTRPSEMIRALRRSGLTYRQISVIAKCSSGAVAAEIRLMKKDVAEGKEHPMTDAPPTIELKSVAERAPGEPKVELELVKY